MNQEKFSKVWFDNRSSINSKLDAYVKTAKFKTYYLKKNANKQISN